VTGHTFLVRLDLSYSEKFPRTDVIGPFADAEAADAFAEEQDGWFEPMDGGYIHAVTVSARFALDPATYVAHPEWTDDVLGEGVVP
jgi:hypothetical protein